MLRFCSQVLLGAAFLTSLGTFIEAFQAKDGMFHLISGVILILSMLFLAKSVAREEIEKG